MVAQMNATVLKGATLIDGVVTDVLLDDGVIGEVAPDITVPDGTAVVDLSGHLLLPAAIEPHAHLDKVFLAEVVPNPTGDLIGAIEAMRANRDRLNTAETVERAERAARLMAGNGYVAVRTHVDVTVDNGLTSLEAVLEVRRRVADVIDVEIVALPGSPVTGELGAGHRTLIREAISAGADLVGGCPHLEGPTAAGVVRATDVLLEIASEVGRPVDLHTDETLDPSVLGLDVLAERVLSGFAFPVTASHCVSLGQLAADRQRAVAERVAAAGISVITLPHTNLFLQGRGRAPMPRGLTAVAALRAAGVEVAAGGDNMQDPFNPLGRGCPFEVAALMVLCAHDLPAVAWEAVSGAARRAIGRGSAAIAPGCPADLLAVRADSLRQAIATGPSERMVWRRGHPVSAAPPHP